MCWLTRLLVVLSMLSGGCRDGSTARRLASPDEEARFLDHVRGLRDRGCACPDLACFDPILEEMLDPARQDPALPDAEVSLETDAAATRTLDELRACQKRLLDRR